MDRQKLAYHRVLEFYGGCARVDGKHIKLDNFWRGNSVDHGGQKPPAEELARQVVELMTGGLAQIVDLSEVRKVA